MPERGWPLSKAAEEVLEIVPGREHGHLHLAGRLEDVAVVDQPAVLGKGDEQHAVEQLLRGADRRVEVGHALLGLKDLDELEPVVVVECVEFFAHRVSLRPGLLQELPGIERQAALAEQAVGVEDGEEAGKCLGIVKLFEQDAVDVVPRLLAAVQPELDEIGHQGPPGGVAGGEVIPGLLHGRALRARVAAVEIDPGALQLADHRDQGVRWPSASVSNRPRTTSAVPAFGNDHFGCVDQGCAASTCPCVQ